MSCEFDSASALLIKSTVSDIYEGLLLIYVFWDGYDILIVFKTHIIGGGRTPLPPLPPTQTQTDGLSNPEVWLGWLNSS